MEPLIINNCTNNILPQPIEEAQVQPNIRSALRKRVQQKKHKSSSKSSYHPQHYNWILTEQRRYIKFLIRHRHYYDLSPQELKQKKINHRMSNFVKVKSSTQCRTHHQKMMQKFKTIDGIIQHYCPIFFGHQEPLMDQVRSDEIKKQPKLQESEYRRFKTSGELVGQGLVKIQDGVLEQGKGEGRQVKQEQCVQKPYLYQEIAKEIQVKEQAL